MKQLLSPPSHSQDLLGDLGYDSPEQVAIDTAEFLEAAGDLQVSPDTNIPPSLSVTESIAASLDRETGQVGKARNSLAERAKTLLGSGITAATVAGSLGVSEGYISQLLSDSVFASEVSSLRYTALQSHNARDDRYDTIEDKLQDKLEQSIPLMIKPDTILKAIQVINGAKRRGATADIVEVAPQSMVTITLPKATIQNFTTNINNQVIKAGNQDLLTIDSDKLTNLSKEETANALSQSETRPETRPEPETETGANP